MAGRSRTWTVIPIVAMAGLLGACSSSSSSSSPLPGSSSSAAASSASPPGSAASSSPAGQAGQQATCIKTANDGACGPYEYAPISASNGSNTQVINNIWNPVSGVSQTLKAANPGQWSVVATMPASNTAVISYPDTQQVFTTSNNTPQLISSFTAITSSYTVSGPGSGSGNDYEAAYDLWAGTGTNNYSQEIMIWVDNHGQTPAGKKVDTTTIDGATYDVWAETGDNPVSMVLRSNKTSGTVDILAALQWLINSNHMRPDSGLNQIDFGFEICSTGGTAKTFTTSRYDLHTASK
jgi:hypothetical protein